MLKDIKNTKTDGGYHVVIQPVGLPYYPCVLKFQKQKTNGGYHVVTQPVGLPYNRNSVSIIKLEREREREKKRKRGKEIRRKGQKENISTEKM